jgi:hypothetical protein
VNNFEIAIFVRHNRYVKLVSVKIRSAFRIKNRLNVYTLICAWYIGRLLRRCRYSDQHQKHKFSHFHTNLLAAFIFYRRISGNLPVFLTTAVYGFPPEKEESAGNLRILYCH